MRVIVSGGGTGGHIYPAVSIVRAIEKQLKDSGDSCDILYVGTSAGLEAMIVPREGLRFETIQVSGIKRSISLKIISTAIKVVVGFFQALSLMRRFKPNIVIGTGGFVCGPVLLAAAICKVPCIIQEQNALPGITNKLLSRFVNKVCLGYREAGEHFPAAAQDKLIYTGNPVRDDIVKVDKVKAYVELGIDAHKKTILVVGGSRGARSINNAMIEVYSFFAGRADVQVLHATGEADFPRMLKAFNELQVPNKENIIVRPYLFNIQNALAVADLAVYRAGAVGLAELAAVGVPAILIPYPYAAENHQEYNARALEKAKAALVILDRDLSGEMLVEQLNRLFSQPQLLADMAKNSAQAGILDAAQCIANIAIAQAGGNDAGEY